LREVTLKRGGGGKNVNIYFLVRLNSGTLGHRNSRNGTKPYITNKTEKKASY
jgi:hypothetical protein